MDTDDDDTGGIDPIDVLVSRKCALEEEIADRQARLDEVNTLLGRLKPAEDGAEGDEDEEPAPKRAARSGGGSRLDPARLLRALEAGPRSIADLSRETGADPRTVRLALQGQPDHFRKTGPKLKDPWELTAGGRQALYRPAAPA